MESVLEANRKAVGGLQKGKTNVVGFLVGQCMRVSKGQGNPGIFKDLDCQSNRNHGNKYRYMTRPIAGGK